MNRTSINNNEILLSHGSEFQCNSLRQLPRHRIFNEPRLVYVLAILDIALFRLIVRLLQIVNLKWNDGGGSRVGGFLTTTIAVALSRPLLFLVVYDGWK